MKTNGNNQLSRTYCKPNHNYLKINELRNGYNKIKINEEIIKNDLHKTSEGLSEIINIKDQMNRGRKYEK